MHFIYSTNIGTEYFKHGLYSSSFSLQIAVCFIILTYLVPVLLTFYIQGVLKLKNNSGTKRLMVNTLSIHDKYITNTLSIHGLLIETLCNYLGVFRNSEEVNNLIRPNDSLEIGVENCVSLHTGTI